MAKKDKTSEEIKKLRNQDKKDKDELVEEVKKLKNQDLKDKKQLEGEVNRLRLKSLLSEKRLKEQIKKIRETAFAGRTKIIQVKDKARDKIAAAIVAAFAFIMALVWRDVIKEFVDKIVEGAGVNGSGYLFTLISAFVTSIICVLGIMYFSKWSDKK